MARLRQVALAGLLLLAGLIAAPPAHAGNPFANWAVIVVAGDYHAHDGGPSEAFDNARRDLTKAFVSEGFSPANISQFSARPAPGAATPPAHPGRKPARHAATVQPTPVADAGPPPLKADGETIYNELVRLTRQAPAARTVGGAPAGASFVAAVALDPAGRPLGSSEALRSDQA